MHDCFLSMGSNMGNRVQYLQRALKYLFADSDIKKIKVSSVYETEPFGNTDQPAFCNAVVWIQTCLPPLRLLQVCLGIEVLLGRIRRERWGPRTIDIDLLDYDHQSWNEAALILPHLGIAKRNFVLGPWSEIAPAWKVDGVEINHLLGKSQDTGTIVCIGQIEPED